MSDNPTVAEVFADRDYGGASLALAVGDYDIEALQASLGNDAISSLKVVNGYKVALYTDARFAGVSKTFTADTPYVGDDFNDQTSSVRVLNISTPTPDPAPASGSEGGQQVVFIQPPSYH
jgi:hypothetical protein